MEVIKDLNRATEFAMSSKNGYQNIDGQNIQVRLIILVNDILSSSGFLH